MLLRPIFCEKLKIAPPIRKQPPLKHLNFRIRPKNQTQSAKTFFFFFFSGDHLFLDGKNLWISDFGRKIWLNFGEDLFFFFFFWRPPVFGRKKPLNFGFRPKNLTQFRRRPFFFLETTCFWAEKTFEFPSFPRNFVWIFGQTVWNWFKNNQNLGQGRLHFSHSFKIAPPPPLFQILATRLRISSPN